MYASILNGSVYNFLLSAVCLGLKYLLSEIKRVLTVLVIYRRMRKYARRAERNHLQKCKHCAFIRFMRSQEFAIWGRRGARNISWMRGNLRDNISYCLCIGKNFTIPSFSWSANRVLSYENNFYSSRCHFKVGWFLSSQ